MAEDRTQDEGHGERRTVRHELIFESVPKLSAQTIEWFRNNYARADKDVVILDDLPPEDGVYVTQKPEVRETFTRWYRSYKGVVDDAPD